MDETGDEATHSTGAVDFKFDNTVTEGQDVALSYLDEHEEPVPVGSEELSDDHHQHHVDQVGVQAASQVSQSSGLKRKIEDGHIVGNHNLPPPHHQDVGVDDLCQFTTDQEILTTRQQQQRLMEKQQLRVASSKRMKTSSHRHNRSNVIHSLFPTGLSRTSPPLLLSYRKKWIDLEAYVQENFQTLSSQQRRRVVHDLFSDSLNMDKIEILKEGEGWSGGYGISGVRRGDMGSGVSQLLSQGFLRL